MKRALILFLKCYCKFLSSLFPESCRFYPSCSTYTLKAVEKYGVLRGIGLGIWRILRCNPWNPGGYDPVP